MEALFESWQLKKMLHYFKTAKIDSVEDLRELSNEKFKEIIEKHADLMDILILKEKLDKWKQEPICHDENFNEINSPVQAAPYRSTPMVLKRKQISRSFGSFNEYFVKDFNGRIIVEKFRKDNLLSNLQKQNIVKAAGEYLVLDLTNFPNSYPTEEGYKNVAAEVMAMFPDLFSLPELVGGKKKDETGRTSYSRGKLQQRMYDVTKLLRRKEAEAGKAAAIPSPGTSSILNEAVIDDVEVAGEDFQELDPLQIEQQMKDDLDFLKTVDGPESKVMELWKRTFSLRREMHFNDFPALRMSFGPSMVLFDFNEMYPGKSKDFKNNFTAYKPKMLRQFSVEISNKVGKERIKFLDGKVDENTEDLLYLSILPFLFKPKATKATNMRKPTMIGAADMFICHVKDEKELAIEINSKKEKQIKSKSTLQPMMFIMGPTIVSITEYIIFCNDTKTHFNNPRDAIIHCYALHFDFNLKFQGECEEVWQLIQLAFFGMENKPEYGYKISETVMKYANFFQTK